MKSSILPLFCFFLLNFNSMDAKVVKKRTTIDWNYYFGDMELLPSYSRHDNIDNNCKSFHGIGKKPENCQIDPDLDLDVPQIIRRHGYPAQAHTVLTDDGYLLGLHRIPGNKKGETGNQPVILQHGLLGSSADWILNGDTALAFLLADHGYDVWLNNARGNNYSKAHVTLSSTSTEFWNFSWHEMGIKDLPAVLHHIGNQTNKSGEIIYIGHSMGTTMGFVLASTLSEVAETIKLFVALAPTVFMTVVAIQLRLLNEVEPDEYLGIGQFKPSDIQLSWLSNLYPNRRFGQNNTYISLLGYNAHETDSKIWPKVLSHVPASTSTKTILHYIQQTKPRGKFRSYDYGTEENIQKYGTTDPPEYDLSKVNRPVYMFYANDDFFANKVDVEKLIKVVPTVVGTTKISLLDFGHTDYIFGMNAYNYVYNPLLGVLQNYTINHNN